MTLYAHKTSFKKYRVKPTVGYRFEKLSAKLMA